jgi:hypothetical protein
MRMKKFLNIFAITLLCTSSLFSLEEKEDYGDDDSVSTSTPSPLCATTSSSTSNPVVITLQGVSITSDDGSFSSFFSNCLKGDEKIRHKLIEQKFYHKDGVFDEGLIKEKIKKGDGEEVRRDLKEKYGSKEVTDDILFDEVKKFNEEHFKKEMLEYPKNIKNIRDMLIKLDEDISKLSDKVFMDALLINIITYCEKTYGGDKINYCGVVSWYSCIYGFPCNILDIFLQFCLFCYSTLGIKEKIKIFESWEKRSELNVPRRRLLFQDNEGKKWLGTDD